MLSFSHINLLLHAEREEVEMTELQNVTYQSSDKDDIVSEIVKRKRGAQGHVQHLRGKFRIYSRSRVLGDVFHISGA